MSHNEITEPRQPTVSLVFALLILCSICSFLPSTAADLQMEGFQYVRAANFAKALDCFNEALKERPKSWVIMQSVANCQMELGRYDMAVSSLQTSIETGGLHASQCHNMAAVYQRSGQAKKALAWLQLACSLDPSTAADPVVQTTIRTLENPANNPVGSKTSPDYLSSLVSFKRWPKEAMPLKVYVRQNIQIPSFYPTFTAMVRDSLDQWCKATGNVISYKFVATPDAADLLLDYTDRPELIRSDHELGDDAATEMRTRMKDNRADRACTVILVKDAPGAPTFKDPVFLTRCCLHELGHALAMDGHSPNPHDVMFPCSTLENVAKLSERDKNTMRKIYKSGT